MNKKLKILILSWRGPGHPNAGGAEISTHEHAKAWVKAGHEVTLFTSDYKGGKAEEIIDGVKIKRRGSYIFGVQMEAFRWYIFENHPKFDLVIDQFHGISFFTPIYVRAKKLGFIHEVTKEVWSLNSWPKPFNIIPTIFGTIFEPLIFKFFYKKIPFFTVSLSTKKDLINWGIPADNITIIQNGINIPTLTAIPSKENKKTIIFLGALSKDKGIEEALKSFSLINKIKNDCQFWVVGKGEPKYLEKLKNKSRKLGIYKKIRFFGFVTEKEKFKLLYRAHIAINPSVREGWGIVVIEAASAGTPTVAFNVAGLRDSILHNKTGIICLRNTYQNMAENILKLMNDEKKYNRISSNAIIWSKNFSWEKSTNDSLKLILSI